MKSCLCHVEFVDCSNTRKLQGKKLERKKSLNQEPKHEFRALKYSPSACELHPVLLVQSLKDILGSVVSKGSWTISLMQVSEYSGAPRVDLEF